LLVVEAEQRSRARVRLSLPIRIRQIGPPVDAVEVSHTLDVSRNGIMFRTRQRYQLDSTVWLTMPYEATTASPHDPEFPATVVRIVRTADGSAEIALRFHSARSDEWTPVHQAGRESLRTDERRAKNRVRMALPIRVRQENAAEESTTIDVSRTGVLFRSAQPYRVGQTVWVAIPYQPGMTQEEVPARVVRIAEVQRVRGVALQFGLSAGTRPSAYSF
jgi:Tfp pilus assembly protein PilZ